MVNWSHLESAIDFLLIRLVGARIDDARPHILISQMQFQAKLQCLMTASTLTESTDPEPHAHFKNDIYSKLCTCQAKRNNLVHSKWSREGGIVKQFKLTAKGKLKVHDDPVTLNELESLFADIQTLLGHIWAVVPLDENPVGSLSR